MNYLAGGQEWLYPHAGDPMPPEDTKILTLTLGGVCVVGSWNVGCIAWLPLPKRNKEKEQMK